MMYTSAFGQSPSGKQINDVGLVPDVPVSSSEPEAAIAAAVLALSASRRGAIKE
jgi:C-terminal processing protease CtpA/Prc